MTETPPEQPPAPPSPSDDRVLGETTGVVFIVDRTHGLIHTDRFGSVSFHIRDLADGLNRLERGQRVSAQILHGKRGRYAQQVHVCTTASGDTLRTPLDYVPRKLVVLIADRLGEVNPHAIIQISRLYQCLGTDSIWNMIEETERIEAEGGMLIPDGSGRRTRAGVFFFQARQHLSSEEWGQIRRPKPPKNPDAPEPPPTVSVPRPPKTPPPVVATITWETRTILRDIVRAGQGRATSVKVTVIGRPASVVERGNTVILMLTHGGPLPAMPKGVPVPPVVPTTTYVVYVAAKQWRGVAEAMKNPEDSLIIEGAQSWDAEQQAIVVYTTKIASKLQQRAKRPTPPTEPTPSA